MWQIFVSKIDKKNVLRGVNFTNLKTPKIETSVGQFANDPNSRRDYAICLYYMMCGTLGGTRFLGKYKEAVRN